MNATISNIKARCAQAVGKVFDSPVCKKAEKLAITVGATASTLGVMAINSSALGTIDGTVVTTTAEPFIDAGIPIMLLVAGYKLGIRFLRGSTH